MTSLRRQSGALGQPALVAAVSNSVDYQSGGVHLNGRRGSGSSRQSGGFVTTPVVPQRVMMPQAHIPLPTDPDPDVHGMPPEVASPAEKSRTMFPAAPTSPNRRGGFNTLPTHARTVTGAPAPGSPTASRKSSSRFENRASPEHLPRSYSTAQPPSPQNVPHTITPGGSLTAATPPQTSPLLKSQTEYLAFPSPANSPATVSKSKLTSNSPGHPSDPLLPTPTGDAAASQPNCLWQALRGIFLVLCCFITPARYDALQASAQARAARRAAEHSASDAFMSYTSSARSRRSAARDRHFMRQKKLVAAAEQQHAKLKADEAAARAAAIGENGQAVENGHSAAAAAAAAEVALARAQLEQQHTILLRETARDSDDEDEEERALASLIADDEERKDLQRRGPCCDRACFPAAWDDARTGCCCRCYVECCTFRRGICVSVYTVLLICLLLFIIYYLSVVRQHGWQWPPSSNDFDD
jgi:hypothetical protein